MPKVLRPDTGDNRSLPCISCGVSTPDSQYCCGLPWCDNCLELQHRCERRDDLDQLRDAVDLLQRAYDRDYAEMSNQWGADATLVRTPEGRYILLDALVTLVNARTVLARVEDPAFAIQEGMVIQPGDVLLLRVDRRLSSEEMDRCSGALKDRLELSEVVFVAGVEGWAVKR